MFWFRLTKLERLFLSLAAITLLFSSALLLDDRWLFKLLSGNESSLVKIGSVRTATNDVRRRHATTFSWAPLDVASEVFQGDSIFTGENSEALITTDRGEQISISPNSLVVINANTDAIRLDIDYGSVLGQVGKDKKLLIGSGGDVTEFKGEDALVKVNVSQDKNLVVKVIEGQVEVKSEEGQKTLGPKEQAAISDEGDIIDPADIHLDLVEPSIDRLIKPNEKNDFRISWKPNHPLPEYTLEVAEDPEFKSIVVREKTSSLTLQPKGLPSNRRLFWRIMTQLKTSPKPIYSQMSSFTLVEDIPPRWKFPLAKMNIFFEEQPSIENGNKINITFHWESRSPSAKWELQLASDPSFQKDVKSIACRDLIEEVGPLSEGTYYTRVRAADWADAAWSETVAFNLFRRDQALMKAPQIVTMDDRFELITRDQNYTIQDLAILSPSEVGKYFENVPLFAWNSIPGATSYEIEISGEPTFDKFVERSEVAGTRFEWMAARPGTFYWRTRSMAGASRKGGYSETQTITLVLAPPHSIIPEKVVDEVSSLNEMESAPPPFLLRWAPVVLAGFYEVEFDKTPSFQKALKIKVPYSFKKIQVPLAGLYYWRVRGLDLDNKPVTDWSKAYAYDYSRKYLNPETTRELRALYPNNETIMMIGKGDLKINFRWATPVKEGSYRFQMSADADFKKTHLDKLVTTNFYLYQREIADGWYYWRVRMETENFTSPWTEAYKFQVKHENSPFDFKQSEKVQEKELKRYAAIQQQQKIEFKKKQAAEDAEIKRLTYLNLPELEAPIELVAPEEFFLEFKPLPASLKKIESLSDSVHSELVRELPQLEWNSVPDATDYLVEFARDQDFKKIFDKIEINRPNLRWKMARPGHFYWRVQARAKDHRPGPYSGVYEFTIQAKSPQIFTPHALVSQASSTGSVVNLRWSNVIFAKSYDLQWSTEPTFATKMETVVKENSFSQSVTNPGLYFWRLRPRGSSGEPLSDYTEPRSINVAIQGRAPAQLKKPQLVYPLTGQKIIHVGDRFPAIAFHWFGPDPNGVYLLEVAKDKDFNEPLARATTRKLEHIIEPQLESGKLFWRLSISNDGQILWRSPVQQIEIANALRKPASPKKIAPKKRSSRVK